MWLLPQCTKEVLKTSRTLWLNSTRVHPPGIYQVVCYTFQRSAPLRGGALNKVLYARTREGFAPRTNRLTFYTMADPGGGSGGPHLPYQTLHLFETEILTSKGLYITF